MAIDLRFVLAMLKINTNLERLGDFAEGIARFVIRCKEPVSYTHLQQCRLVGLRPDRVVGFLLLPFHIERLTRLVLYLRTVNFFSPF